MSVLRIAAAAGSVGFVLGTYSSQRYQAASDGVKKQQQKTGVTLTPGEEVAQSVTALMNDAAKDGAPLANRFILVFGSHLPHNIFTAASGKTVFPYDKVVEIAKTKAFTGALPRVVVGTGTLTIHTTVFNKTKEHIGTGSALAIAAVIENAWRVPGLAIMNKELLGTTMPSIGKIAKTVVMTFIPRGLYLAAPKLGMLAAVDQGLSEKQGLMVGTGVGLLASFTVGRVSEEAAIAVSKGEVISMRSIASKAFTVSHMSRAGIAAYTIRESIFVLASMLGTSSKGEASESEA